MGGKFKQRKRAVRKWVTKDDALGINECELWDDKPFWNALYWDDGDYHSVQVCENDLRKMGIRPRADKPLLVEFTARIVEEGE